MSNWFKRKIKISNPIPTPAMEMPETVRMGPVPVAEDGEQFMDFVRVDAEARRLFGAFVDKEFSTENWEAFEFLKGRCTTVKEGDWKLVLFNSQAECHYFYNKFFNGNPRYDLNVPGKAKPASPADLTPRMMGSILAQVLSNLRDTWSRFELTDAGRRVTDRLGNIA